MFAHQGCSLNTTCLQGNTSMTATLRPSGYLRRQSFLEFIQEFHDEARRRILRTSRPYGNTPSTACRARARKLDTPRRRRLHRLFVVFFVYIFFFCSFLSLFFWRNKQALRVPAGNARVRFGREETSPRGAGEELRVPHLRDEGTELLHRRPHAPPQDRQAGGMLVLLVISKMLNFVVCVL